MDPLKDLKSYRLWKSRRVETKTRQNIMQMANIHNGAEGRGCEIEGMGSNREDLQLYEVY